MGLGTAVDKLVLDQLKKGQGETNERLEQLLAALNETNRLLELVLAAGRSTTS